jgi:hypothetical protein
MSMNREGLIFGLALAIALVGSLYNITQIENFITQGPWFVLGIFNVVLCLLLFFKKTPNQIPSGRSFSGLIVMAGFFVLSSLWNHSTFFEERWIQRYIFFLMAFLVLQFSTNRKQYIRALCFALIPYTFWICSESFYQFFAVCRAGDPLERSCFAGNFGNINMLSQYLALSLPIVFYTRKELQQSRWSAIIDFLVVLMSSLILLSACRSSILAMIAVYIMEILKPWAVDRKRAFAMAILSSLIFLMASNRVNIDTGQGALGSTKENSARYRLQIWEKTIEMGLDHPLGAGVNNFEYGFLPYKLTSSLAVESREVDKSPHNEFLRLFSEDGWPSLLLILSLMGIFLFRQVPKFFQTPQGSFGLRYLLCCLPEIIFQFPTDMWSPVLLSALAVPLIYDFKFRPVKFSIGIKAGLLLLSLVLPVLVWVRQVRVIPAEFSSVYCQLFPDEWKMCGEYFKVHFEAHEFQAASNAIAPVIRRQPFNFIALHFDYLLGNPENNSKLACNYWNLFRGQASIPGSDVSGCEKIENREALIDRLSRYARER